MLDDLDGIAARRFKQGLFSSCNSSFMFNCLIHPLATRFGGVFDVAIDRSVGNSYNSRTLEECTLIFLCLLVRGRKLFDMNNVLMLFICTR